MAEKKKIRNWKGSRGSYEYLKKNGLVNAWTHYFVVETTAEIGSTASGRITEYFGENLISVPTGQLLPVLKILEFAKSVDVAEPYERYLVGTDEAGYNVVEYVPIRTAEGDTELVKNIIPFDEKYGVRVKDRGLKNYVYVDGKLITYDDVNCGEF